MRKSLATSVAAIVLAAAFANGAQAAESAPVGPLKFDAVTFPAYDSYRGMKRYAPTPQAYQEAINDRRFVMERITYRSDGLEVYAYLYRPRIAPKGGKMPVIVFNRGSYTRDDFSPEVLMPAHRLAQQGYLVVAPMLRGSGGAKGHDEMGGADVHDLFNIVPVLDLLGYADTGRLFLYGESRGAIMNMLAARDRFPARAIAVYGLTTDFSKLIGEGQPGRALGANIWPGFPAGEAQIVESRSAIRWPEKINTPVLLMNGGDDDTVSPENSLALAAAFTRLKKPYELKIFYGEGHVLGGRAAERDEDAVRWFRRFDVAADGSKAGAAR